MKTELRLAPHSVIPGAKIIELWYAGQFIGQVVGADGPGVRVLSKHALTVETEKADDKSSTADGKTVQAVKVMIGVRSEGTS